MGSWEYQSFGETATIVFEDSTISYFVSPFGLELVKINSNPYKITDSYLIQFLNKQSDTSVYQFIDSNKLMLIDLRFNDTMMLNKIK